MSRLGREHRRHTHRKQMETIELVGFVGCGSNCNSLGAFCSEAPAASSVAIPHGETGTSQRRGETEGDFPKERKIVRLQGDSMFLYRFLNGEGVSVVLFIVIISALMRAADDRSEESSQSCTKTHEQGTANEGN